MLLVRFRKNKNQGTNHLSPRFFALDAFSQKPKNKGQTNFHPWFKLLARFCFITRGESDLDAKKKAPSELSSRFVLLVHKKSGDTLIILPVFMVLVRFRSLHEARANRTPSKKKEIQELSDRPSAKPEKTNDSK